MVSRVVHEMHRLSLALKRPGPGMVGDTRFELVTPSMSTKCSTTELIAPVAVSGPNERGAENRASPRVYK